MTTDFLKEKLSAFQAGWILPSLKDVNMDAHSDVPLHRVHFYAKSGEVTAVLGKQFERHQLMTLLGGRKRHGKFDGDILLSGPGLTEQSYYYDHMAYVQRELLYSPGLSYLETLRFAVQLRLKTADDSAITSSMVEERVNELIQLFNLSHCKDHKMPAYPEERSESGGDMRRLAIAMECANLPPLIVIDEPTKGLDVALSLNIMYCVQSLAKRGHIVVCSMTKPFAQEMEMVGRIMLLSEGWTIFDGSKRTITPFFTSPLMGYDLRKDVDLADFLLDVADGTERPVNSRAADLPFIMQQKFEESDYCRPVTISTPHAISAFHKDFFFLMGYARFDKPQYALRRLLTNIKRAIYTKAKDPEQFKLNIAAPIVVSITYGYINYGTSSYGNFTTSLLGLPYPQTANLKVEVFRYEQLSGITTSFAFILSAIISEVPYTVIGSLIASSIIYGLADLGAHQTDELFYIQTLILLGLLGISGAYMLALLIRKELLIRDFLLITITLCAMLSGFPVQLSTMPWYISRCAGINPLRWSFEGLLAWKFAVFEDGESYLATYGFESFDYKDTHSILSNFIWVTMGLAIAFCLKEPNLLRRVPKSDGHRQDVSTSRESVDSLSEAIAGGGGRGSSLFLPRKSTRQSEAVKPMLFMRESSVTTRVPTQLSINLSQTGELNLERGPTVTFKDINFRVRDRATPGGQKTILNRVSGQFDWGKLSMVMGAAGSGKSSLIHVLAGDIANGSEITGQVFFNGKPVDKKQTLWQRCGFVPIQNEHFRDLSVLDVVRFAMLLRCYNRKGLPVVDNNVQKTIEILHLEDVKLKKTKQLNNGELKRLSIAEEMVSGPKLLLMDEPLTGVSMSEVSILVSTFREMVNQDRTVVASVHQPSQEVFKLFDTLLLLSKGRAIFYGPVSNAAKYFVSSPYQYNLTSYTNPADFFADVSGGFVPDIRGDFVDPSLLENYYKQTDVYNRLYQKVKKLELENRGEASVDVTNPLARPSDLESGSISLNNPDEAHVAVSTGDGNRGVVENKEGVIVVGKPRAPLPFLVQGLMLPFQEIFTLFSSFANLETAIFKGYILFYRSFIALINRTQLLINSNVTHIGLAILFGWFMGDSSGSAGIYNTTAFFALSCMFLILTNIPIGFYMFNNHGVFLKEHARGLYPNILKWVVTDYPLYFLRAVNAIFFFLVAWSMINQDTENEIYCFALLCYITFVETSVAMAEFIVFSSDTKRHFYERITLLAFFNVLLSGLLVKASTMPVWIAPWAPSISMVRWSMQANFLNLYENSDVFPTLPSGYSPYIGFLNLYGWGGKTKWYCWGMLCIILLACKFLALWMSGSSAMARKGGAHYRQIVAKGLD
eukprot:gene8620-9499_t